ncbi:hypothetical protein Q1695_005917 [Nippostrongylus brasiliensis]|nr:hypothetical protein Q1695_005917 [Nippostrongylus brasiliensis]
MRTLLLLGIVVTSTAEFSPMSGWIKNLKNGNCYMYVCDWVNFTVARSECEKLGAALATICDDDENEFIAILARGSFISGWCNYARTWIGMVRDGKTGIKEEEMRWLSQETCPYRNFNKGEPNDLHDRNEDCVHFWTGSDRIYNKWNDERCWKTAKYVCQRKCDVPMIPVSH